MIEAGIFIIHEGRQRGLPELVERGVNYIDWGWDKEYGGLFNDVNTEGQPFADGMMTILGSTKLWWQHTEAIYGLLRHLMRRFNLV